MTSIHCARCGTQAASPTTRDVLRAQLERDGWTFADDHGICGDCGKAIEREIAEESREIVIGRPHPEVSK